MRTSLNRRYKMFKSVAKVFTDNASILDAVPALQRRVTTFRAQQETINSGIGTGMETTEGLTESKNRVRTNAGNDCYALAHALCAIAQEQRDDVRQKKLPLTLTEYQQGKEIELLAKFQLVMTEARLYRRDLEGFGFTEGEIARIDGGIAEFAEKMDTPKQTRTANSIKLTSYHEEFKKMDAILDGLDHVVNALMVSRPEFYQAYSKARVVGASAAAKEKEPNPPAERKSPAPAPPVSPFHDSERPILQGGGPYERPMPK